MRACAVRLALRVGSIDAAGSAEPAGVGAAAAATSGSSHADTVHCTALQKQQEGGKGVAKEVEVRA